MSAILPICPAYAGDGSCAGCRGLFKPAPYTAFIFAASMEKLFPGPLIHRLMQPPLWQTVTLDTNAARLAMESSKEDVI